MSPNLNVVPHTLQEILYVTALSKKPLLLLLCNDAFQVCFHYTFYLLYTGYHRYARSAGAYMCTGYYSSLWPASIHYSLSPCLDPLAGRYLFLRCCEYFLLRLYLSTSPSCWVTEVKRIDGTSLVKSTNTYQGKITMIIIQLFIYISLMEKNSAQLQLLNIYSVK